MLSADCPKNLREYIGPFLSLIEGRLIVDGDSADPNAADRAKRASDWLAAALRIGVAENDLAAVRRNWVLARCIRPSASSDAATTPAEMAAIVAAISKGEAGPVEDVAAPDGFLRWVGVPTAGDPDVKQLALLPELMPFWFLAAHHGAADAESASLCYARLIDATYRLENTQSQAHKTVEKQAAALAAEVLQPALQVADKLTGDKTAVLDGNERVWLARLYFATAKLHERYRGELLKDYAQSRRAPSLLAESADRWTTLASDVKDTSCFESDLANDYQRAIRQLQSPETPAADRAHRLAACHALPGRQLGCLDPLARAARLGRCAVETDRQAL